MSSPKILASKLRMLMPAHGFDQAELARRSGIKPNSVSRYLAGLNMPRPAQLAKLAAALDVTVGELLAAESPESELCGSPNLLCLTQKSTDGMVRLQIDQSVPGEVATQIVALLLRLPKTTEAAMSVTARDKNEIARAPGSRSARPAAPAGTLADILIPRTPQQPERVRQVLRLDGPPQRPLNGDTRA